MSTRADVCPNLPLPHTQQSKGLHFVTLGQPARGLRKGEQPTRPRSYRLIQRPCRNFLLCDLGLANNYNQAEAVTLLSLRGNACL